GATAAGTTRPGGGQIRDNRQKGAALPHPPFPIQAVKAGLKDLGSAVSMIGPSQGPAAYTLRSWAKANEETLVKYLQAYIEGVRWALDPAPKAAATEMLARRPQLPPRLPPP